MAAASTGRIADNGGLTLFGYGGTVKEAIR